MSGAAEGQLSLSTIRILAQVDNAVAEDGILAAEDAVAAQGAVAGRELVDLAADSDAEPPQKAQLPNAFALLMAGTARSGKLLTLRCLI
jgi:hypothetical protein